VFVRSIQTLMRHTVRTILLAALAAALLLPATASAAPQVTLGIADQKVDMFYDQRFTALGIRHARLNVPWDALTVPWQRDELDRWLLAAQEAGVEPLVTFGHARSPVREIRRVLPTPERYRYEVRRFRQRYPWVRSFGTWNEANHCGEPTCHRPRIVAAYWRMLRLECRGCTVLAATVLDLPNMAGWVRSFRRHARMEPRWWGLHNYVDANRFRTSGTRRLLRATRGEVWLTETGGLVARRRQPGSRHRPVRLRESPTHAARALRFLFTRLVPMSPRIRRVYLYHWNAGGPGENWDSALLTPAGRPRPGYRVVERYLARARRR
jgi:hypothetical protein